MLRFRPCSPARQIGLAHLAFSAYLTVLVSVADPDPDPVGSVYDWLSWIRIRILYMDPDPDPAAFKMITIRKLFLLFLTFN